MKILVELDGLILTKKSNGSYLIDHDGFKILTQDYYFAIDYFSNNVLQKNV